MARSNSEIDTIIAELKTRRNTRDAAIEAAAADVDSSDPKRAERLRSLKHVKEMANDTDVCLSCRLSILSDGDFCGMMHTSIHIEDITVGSETIPGLKTLLIDESYIVTGSTTVENL